MTILSGCDIEGMTKETQELGEKIKAGHNRPPANGDSAPTKLPYYVDEGESVSIHTADGTYQVKLPSPEGWTGPPPRVIETPHTAGSHEFIVITDNFVAQKVLMDGKPVELQ